MDPFLVQIVVLVGLYPLLALLLAWPVRVWHEDGLVMNVSGREGPCLAFENEPDASR
jgi:hypothetical protein